MSLKIDKASSTLVAKISYDVVSLKAKELGKKFDIFFESKKTKKWKDLSIDLKGVKMIDSLGLNLLVSILKAVDEKGGKTTIMIDHDNLFRIFEYTRISKLAIVRDFSKGK